MPNATTQRADGSSARIGLIEKANRAQPIAAAANQKISWRVKRE